MIQTLTRIGPPTRESSRQHAIPERIHQGSVHLALEQVLACEDAGPAFCGRLRRYAPFLAAEYEEQATCGGLYAEVLQLEPGLSHRVDMLRHGQQRIVRGLNGLIELLRDEPADSSAGWSARQRLLSALREQRHAEEQLLIDAYFQDSGGGWG